MKHPHFSNTLFLCLRPVRVPEALCFRVVRPSVRESCYREIARTPGWIFIILGTGVHHEEEMNRLGFGWDPPKVKVKVKCSEVNNFVHVPLWKVFPLLNTVSYTLCDDTLDKQRCQLVRFCRILYVFKRKIRQYVFSRQNTFLHFFFFFFFLYWRVKVLHYTHYLCYENLVRVFEW